MHTNAAQKDRFAVQENVRTSGLDAAKANRVSDRIAARRKNDLVQLGIFR